MFTCAPPSSPDYRWSVLVPWGTPIFDGVAELDPLDVASNPAALQDQQVGFGHDGIWFFPIGGSSTHGVLCINHQYGTNPHVLGRPQPIDASDVAKSIAAHGVTGIEVRRQGDQWVPVRSPRNFRVTGASPVAFSGPVPGPACWRTRPATPPGAPSTTAGTRTPRGGRT